MKRHRLHALVTHLACLALGWWVCAAAVASKKPVAAEEGRRPREAVKSGEQILDEVLKGKKGGHVADFQRVQASMEEPADFAAALDRAAAKWAQQDQLEGKTSAEMVALLYKWMEKDLLAAYAWAGTDPLDPRYRAFQAHEPYAFSDLLKDKGWRAGSAVMGSKSPLTGRAVLLLATACGSEGSVAEYARLRDMATPSSLRPLRQELGRLWPEARREELLQLALSENAPEMLRGLGGRVMSLEMMHWVRGLEAGDSLPPLFKREIAGNSAWHQMAITRRDFPLEERLSMMHGGMGAEFLAVMDLNAALNEGRDWRHAFRHGQAAAGDIWAAVSGEIPEMAAAVPEVLRKNLYFHLVEEDSEAARALLEGLPEDEQDRMALEATQTAFKNVDPARFLEALEPIPSDSPELWEARLEAWDQGSAWNLRRLNEDYVAWVRELPPGLDREMGLFSLAKAAGEKDPELAEQLRGEILDPKLRQRLEGRE
ncbi:hypothetical protein [Luteolibacter sp. Populi]|uniref:hypothetical protein n=1 Tax=Luteolibacter sp. Populi TaxID=3230487 RepID=UPI0034668CF7